jgi:release factor glutamine methyltransferase
VTPAAEAVPGAGTRGSGDERWTVLRLMLWSADYLASKGVESARLDAEHLLAHVLGVGRLEMYLQHERPLEPGELDAFRPLLRRRASREPLQHILGRQAFRELDLEVGPAALIPRPETERLVQEVLDWARSAATGSLSALDVGTGTGAIALSLLAEGPFGRVVATDVSPRALELAARNARSAGLETGLELREGAYFEAAPDGERFDVVVSNPPYVAETDWDALQPEVLDWEPVEALFAGPDGLSALREIVEGAGAVLRPGGLLALEVGAGQADRVVEMIEGCGDYRDVRVLRDLAGKQRVVMATRASTTTAERGM